MLKSLIGLNDGEGTQTGPVSTPSVTNTGTLIESSTVSPAALAAGETVLLTPASDTREINLTSSGVAFLCSLLAGTTGQRKWLRNTGAYSITLGHDEGASYGGAAAANCFACPDAIPYVLRPGAAVEVMYTGSRWRVLGVNVFAPGGRLCPPTIAEFKERTAFTPTHLWPCDDGGLGSGQPLREANNANLTVGGTPLFDFKLGGYRGVQITEGGNGWRDDVADPGANSIIVGAFYGHGALVSDNIIAGRVEVLTASRRAYVGTKAAGKASAYFHDGTTLLIPEANKLVDDSIVRLTIGQLDKVAALARCRVSGRGEAAVASPDVDASAIGTISGGDTPRNTVGRAGLTGSVVNTFVGGVFQIYGATAAGANTAAKIAHRLGME